MEKKSNPVRRPPSRTQRDGVSRLGRLMSNGIKLIIGLGNPGRAYAHTYHNAGFLALDYMAKNPSLMTRDYQLLKSSNSMNESGFSVNAALKKTGTVPEQLLVIHDDSDLLIGEYKLSFARGAAGHHGVQSIIKTIKTNRFWRLRIGVRGAQNKNKAGNFVLKTITATDKNAIWGAIKRAMGDL